MRRKPASTSSAFPPARPAARAAATTETTLRQHRARPTRPQPTELNLTAEELKEDADHLAMYNPKAMSAEVKWAEEMTARIKTREAAIAALPTAALRSAAEIEVCAPAIARVLESTFARARAPSRVPARSQPRAHAITRTHAAKDPTPLPIEIEPYTETPPIPGYQAKSESEGMN